MFRTSWRIAAFLPSLLFALAAYSESGKTWTPPADDAISTAQNVDPGVLTLTFVVIAFLGFAFAVLANLPKAALEQPAEEEMDKH